MTSAWLVLADEPGAWAEVEFRGRAYRARMDPMWMGAELLPRLIDRPPLVRLLFDERGQTMALTADPFGRHTVALLQTYLDVVGIGLEGLARLIHALEHLDALEIDLLRLGLDVRDWLNPEGPLSSRRVSLLIADFLNRPETILGAKRLDLFPLSKGEILLAQHVGGPEEGEPHQFLKSPSALEAEHRARVEEAEKRERIKKRGF